MAYKVELETYAGPLDLLLYLIKQEEVDIYDIPIARILDRYLKYLESGVRIDINHAAEFLVMASTLMEIKSRMLLPVEERPAEEEDEEDPRASLVRQLLAFRAFKEAAGRLGEMREVRQRRYVRARRVVLPGDEKPAEPEPLKDVTLFDLADGYARLMKQTMGSGPRTILYDEISMEERQKAILGALALRPEFALRALFGGDATAVQLAGTFFALLELVRQRSVRIFQNADFGEILVKQRGEGESDLEKAEVEPAGPYVEPLLPPPVERPKGPDGKKFRARGRRHFGGVERPEEADDDFIASDDAEARLSKRIDRILHYADEISEGFEASQKRKRREADGSAIDLASAAAGLEAAMAGLEGEVGFEAGGGQDEGADSAPGEGGPPSDGEREEEEDKAPAGGEGGNGEAAEAEVTGEADGEDEDAQAKPQSEPLSKPQSGPDDKADPGDQGSADAG